MNPMLSVTLDEAVGEVLNYLTGLDLHYIGELDRYRSITKQLNRALRLTATEHEWSYYSALEELGRVYKGQTSFSLRKTSRPRMQTDDALRLVDDNNAIHQWAYFLPRESLHKYQSRQGLWVSSTRNEILFSRPIIEAENNLRAFIPVMREPKQFVTPATLENIEDLTSPTENNIPDNGELIQLRNFHNPDIIEEWVTVPGLPPYEYSDPEKSLSNLGLSQTEIRNQVLDFPHPDLIIMKAAYLYAQTDPIMQPRVQTLDAQYKDLFYALVERDTNITDDPYRNDFNVPIQGSLNGNPYLGGHPHPHSDERNWYSRY